MSASITDVDDDAVGRARRVVAAAGATLPFPGSGATAERFDRLAELARLDISTGRLVEAHVDAEAILADLGGRAPGPSELWGVWAAEGPGAALGAHPAPTGSEWVLTGTKPWCSGAVGCSHALITARHDGRRRLLAVDLSAPGVTVGERDWHNAGMRGTETHAVTFDATPATMIADADDYFGRPGFWHGAVGVAACWFGGAQRVADRLREHHRDDDIAMMHLAAVDVALWTGATALRAAAGAIDASPHDNEAGHVLALRVRAHIEAVAGEVIDRVGRSTGPGPLAADAAHAQAVADLTVYIRQSHAERDLIALGRVLRAQPRHADVTTDPPHPESGDTP